MKRLHIILLALFLIFLPLRVHADEPYIIDECGQLSESEADYLEELTEQFARTYQLDLYFVLVDGEAHESVSAFAQELMDGIRK